LPYNFLKFLQVNRFLYVAVHPQPVTFHQVSLLIRGSKDNHWNGARTLVRFYSAEHLVAADARQLEIEEDEPRGPFETAPRVCPAAEQKIERFGAVAYNFYMVREPLFAKRENREFGVGRVVFDQQYCVFLGTHAFTPITSGIWSWFLAFTGSEK
jgi:hypothetical protein